VISEVRAHPNIPSLLVSSQCTDSNEITDFKNFTSIMFYTNIKVLMRLNQAKGYTVFLKTKSIV
jgi:hypothetical protein